MKIRQSAEDYLKYIFILGKTQEVHGSALAEIMGFSRPTVCVALKNLEREGYITMNENRAVTLTDLGYGVAQRIYERNLLFHRLLVSLGVDECTAKEDACKMEHAVSQESFMAFKKLIKE